MAVVINGNGSISGLDTKGFHDSALTNTQILATDTHDSVAVQAQFDSAFPSAFDTRFALQDTHDSALVQAQIDSDLAGFTSYDSAKVQGQFDSAFPSAFDTRFALQDTHDSARVQAQFDSAFALQDTHDSALVQGQIDATIAATDTHDSAKVQGQFDSALPVALASDVSLGNITTTGYLRGPATFEIDPATHGDETGTLRVRGNLTVEGTTTTINSTTVETTDLAFTLAKDAADSAACQGAGFIVKDAATASFTYSHDSSAWVSSKNLNVKGNYLRVGRVDEQSGVLELWGGPTGATEGAQINLHPTADYAGYYGIDAYSEDLRFLNYTTDGYYRFYGPGNSGTIDFVKNVNDMTIELGSSNYQTIIGNWSSALRSDVDGLLPGSAFGTFIQGANNGHFTIGLRGNDANDGFNIVSGGGDYQTDTTYDTMIAHFRADGRVGINTTSMNAKLEVGDTSETLGSTASDTIDFVRLKATMGTGNVSYLDVRSVRTSAGSTWTTSATRIQQRIDTTDQGFIQFNGNTNNYGITFGSGANERFMMQQGGDFHADGDVVAYSTTVSDVRLKEDVKTIENSLDKVSQLRGVSYTWNAGSREGQQDLGLIAQEVEEVFPEIVREKELALVDGKSYKTVDYEKLVGVLVEAVKELKAEIDELKGNQ